jgi:hypothetical protein
LGFIIYLFTPVTLWFHSNVYMSDMMVQSFYIIGIYLVLKLTSGKKAKISDYIWFAFINFLMVDTEWLGFFFAVTVIGYTVFYRKDPGKKYLLTITALTTILALALTIWQFSQINGFKAFITSSIEKYQIRSGIENADMGLSLANPQTWLNIIAHYLAGYWPVLIILGLFAVLHYWRRNGAGAVKTHLHQKTKPIPAAPDSLWKPALIFSGIPVLLHHAAFVNFTAVHDFSVLKTAVLLSILAG